jgi:rhamnosyltransferase
VKVTQADARSHREPISAGTGARQTTVAQSTHSVAACIVSYNPGPEVRLALCSVLPQVSKVFVIDNASKPESEVALAGLCAEFGVVLTLNKDNIGVAGAYNQAASMATNQGYEWLLLMDQDSVAPDGLVPRLMRAAQRREEAHPAAVLCPLSTPGDPSGHQSVVPDIDVVVGACINAGSIVRLAAWEAVGGYNEDLFVDYVDFDFCFRCREDGWEVVQACDTVMVHSDGCPTRHRILWRRALATNHSAVRRYYIARNRVLFYRRHWRFDARWVLRDVFSAVKGVALVILFESGKCEKLIAMAVGVVDGCRGITGKTVRTRFVPK